MLLIVTYFLFWCKGEELALIDVIDVTNSNVEWFHESRRHDDIFLRKPLERVERSVHKREPDTAYRVVDSDDSKNNSSANVNKTVEHGLLLANFKRLWPVWRWKEVGYFSDDYLDLINDHWLQFTPPNETSQKILAVLYLLFATVGCWGNVIVLLMYLR